MWMKYSTLSETKTASFKKDISKQIEFLAEKVGIFSTALIYNLKATRPASRNCCLNQFPLIFMVYRFSVKVDGMSLEEIECMLKETKERKDKVSGSFEYSFY